MPGVESPPAEPEKMTKDGRGCQIDGCERAVREGHFTVLLKLDLALPLECAAGQSKQTNHPANN
jgi:hypothetical protein